MRVRVGEVLEIKWVMSEGFFDCIKRMEIALNDSS